MDLGSRVMEKQFDGLSSGYDGPRIEREGRSSKFVGQRSKTLHGLFGAITYRRACYFARGEGGGGYYPMDEQLGIRKRHTPACQYFVGLFTGGQAYGKGLGQFHEIFRPGGSELISMRKALDMNEQLGGRLEKRRKEEIRRVYEQGEEVATERPISDVMAVSVDATKLRQRGRREISRDRAIHYPIQWRDVKVGAVSSVSWDSKRAEAFCSDSSYVSSIEHADEFFKRMTVEIQRRTAAGAHPRVVCLADGAKWIWDRFADVVPEGSVFILDFYHACEHVSDLSKVLYGEGTKEYWEHFRYWKKQLMKGKVKKYLSKLSKLRSAAHLQKTGEEIRRRIEYFKENQQRMRYDQYRKAKLPIGSGTIESTCKNVIGGRMKQVGMTWSPDGADHMLQIRTSQESGRYEADFQETLLDPAA